MAQDDIQGQVVDPSGNPVSGAIVELTKSFESNPVEEQTVLRTTTDSNGNYIFEFHPDGDGTTQDYHVSCYNHDGSAYVNSFNNPGVTADLPSNAIPDSVVSREGDNGSFANSNKNGTRIETSETWPKIGARISSNTSGYTRAYIYRVSDEQLMGETDISSLSSGDTFTIQLSTYLTSGEEYNFVLDAEGADWTFGYYFPASPPYTSSDGNLTIVDGGVGKSGTDENGNPLCLIEIGNVGFA